MKIIFGLGNPGQNYQLTRHNAGFLVLDQIADRLNINFGKKVCDCDCASSIFHDQKIILAKPQLFMNHSGFAVSKLSQYYKVDFNDILIIHDDLDLPPAQIRFKSDGGSGGQKGVTSIIEQLGIDKFSRLKIGIGKAPFDTVDYVLKQFNSEDIGIYQPAFLRAAVASLDWIDEGIAAAMNKYNIKNKENTDTIKDILD